MTLEDILAKPALAVTALAVIGVGDTFQIIKLINRHFYPPITEHIGDFTGVAMFALLSGGAAWGLDVLQEKYHLRVLGKIANYLPEILTGLLVTYVTLGETVIDIIPGNTKDPLDIPAALVAATAGYVIAKRFHKFARQEYL